MKILSANSLPIPCSFIVMNVSGSPGNGPTISIAFTFNLKINICCVLYLHLLATIIVLARNDTSGCAFHQYWVYPIIKLFQTVWFWRIGCAKHTLHPWLVKPLATITSPQWLWNIFEQLPRCKTHAYKQHLLLKFWNLKLACVSQIYQPQLSPNSTNLASIQSYINILGIYIIRFQRPQLDTGCFEGSSRASVLLPERHISLTLIFGHGRIRTTQN